MKHAPEKIRLELQKISDAHDGLLHPQTVVERARSPRSPLHSYFEWDDTAAAHAHRLQQARQLIRATVTVIGRDSPAFSEAVIASMPVATVAGKPLTISTPAFVSLTTDRVEGGYRRIETILTDAELRAQLLTDALAELELFRAKYQHLAELTQVFKAISKIKIKKSS